MAQKHQHAYALAGTIIREQYGDITEKVCSYLLSKGSQTLPEVVRGTGLPLKDVRQALLVLIQHNCVTSYLVKEEATLKGNRHSYFIYQPQIDAILQLIRKPKYLLHVKEEVGEVAESIVEVLLEHGRLRLDQIVSAVASKQHKGEEHEQADEAAALAELGDSVRSQFMSLVHSHYVERAPPATLPPPTVSPHPNSVKTKKAKPGSAEFAAQQAAMLKSLEEAAYDKERFKLPSDLLLDGLLHERNGAGPGNEEGGEGPAVVVDMPVQPPPPKKQKIVAGSNVANDAAPSSKQPGGSSSGAGLQPPGSSLPSSSANLLWRFNCEELNRRFRHQACINMVAEKLDKDAGIVLAAMLSATRQHEHKLNEDRSVPMSEEDVVSTASRLMDQGTLPRIEKDSITVLRTLANDSLELVSYIGEGPGGSTYCVNMQRIIDLIRLKQLEAVVRDRFGVPALRIFRLLLLRGQLEQKQISDFAMMPQKDCRELLYRMLRGGFLGLQEISKTSDHAPSRTFYTWRANVAGASECLAAELYKAAFNALTRLKFEMMKDKEIIELIEQAKETGVLTVTFTATQKARIGRLQKVSQLLETNLLLLDDMISVFNDF